MSAIKRGTFTFIYGPMFSGKTEELLRVGKRYEIAGKGVAYFKPAMDRRYGSGVIVTHSKLAKPAKEVSSFDDIYPVIHNTKPSVVLIDEVQFLKEPKREHVLYLLDTIGVDIVVSGLVLDAARIPFPTSACLLPYADVHVKLNAVCTKCGNFNAVYTHRVDTAPAAGQILVGGSEFYWSLCKDCYAETSILDMKKNTA